jgi:sugar lactone lactonase YvrE
MNLRPAPLLWIAGVAAALTSSAQAQTISTYAGGGAAANYPALEYSVAPTTIAVASGGVYFGNFFAIPNSIAGPGSAVYQLNPSTGNLTLVAGTNTPGYSGDGGAATSAQILTICGVAANAAGDVYIADCDSEVIRRVDGTSGIITTFAGNGSGGYTGDGGPATSATLNSPHGLTIDGAGNLYIADTLNSAIRRVAASTGVITTVAGNGTAGYSGNGGLATHAELNDPDGVAVDTAGNLYIADSQNNVVRLVTAATGNISTFAGTTQAGYTGDGGAATAATLNVPEGVALDSAGDLYIADTFNSVIRLVNASTKNITTAAGDGSAGYSGDGGLATAASLNLPAAVAIDGSGNLYIPDQYDLVIRLVNSSGTISTIAGDTFSSYGGDGGSATGAQMNEPMGAVAVDPSGNLIIPDSSNHAVRRVAASGGTITTIAGTGVAGYSGDGGQASSAQLNNPEGVAVDSAGNIFIADAGNNVVRRIDASSGVITTFAGIGGPLNCGYTGDNGPATSAKLCFPGGIAFDAGGNLYIADTDSSAVRRVAVSTGIITTVAGNGTRGYSGDGGLATGAELNIPNTVAVDGAGNLYIADSYNWVIRKVFTNGEIITVAGDHAVGYSGDGGPATGASLNYPFGVTVDGVGNIYIADTYNSVVRFVDVSSGQIRTIVGNGTYGFAGDGGAATAAEIAYPWGVTLDPSGRLFVTDLFNSRIRLVNALQSTFTVKPTTLNFGNTFVRGTSSPMTVAVQNTGQKTLGFSVTIPSGKPFSQSNNCAAVAPQASCTISVTFAPTSAGAQNTSLSISAGAGNTQAVQLLGNGVKLTVSPTSLNFGNQIRGLASASQTVTLATGSIGPISITSIAIGTTEYSQTNNCVSSLAANSSCTINVVFKPAVKGALTGAVSIKTNAGNFSVALSGTGVLPVVSPTGLTFANQIRGTTSNSQAVTVTNGSNDVLSIASISIASAQYSQTNSCGSSVPANSSCTINVVFKPTVKGTLTGTLAIKTGNAGNYNVTLSGTGVVPSVSPTGLSFGDQTHGTSSSPQPVTITNNGNQALSITGISITAPRQFSQTNSCGSAVPANSSCKINVVFNPTVKGALSATLSIKTVGPGTYSVALSGTGT